VTASAVQNSSYTVPKLLDVEVDEEPDRESGEPEVGKQLSAVDGCDGLHCLHFDNYKPINNQIDA
jgi:hypothetical protein